MNFIKELQDYENSELKPRVRKIILLYFTQIDKLSKKYILTFCRFKILRDLLNINLLKKCKKGKTIFVLFFSWCDE